MKNILITGGAGYVGYSVTKEMALKYPQSKIIIYDSFSKARIENFAPLLFKYKNIVLIPWEKADIRDSDNFEAVLSEYKPETVIHLAAIVDAFSTNREGKDRECMIVNYEATVKIAEISKKNGVKNFIFQSSVSIYSRGEDLKEDSPKESISVYGKSKLLAEIEILKLASDTFKVTCLRSATLVGYNPCFRCETIINLLCARSVFGIETSIFESALSNPKSYLTLEDEVKAITLLLEKIDIASGQSYNAVSFSVSLDKVLDEVFKHIKKEEVKYKIVPQKTISQQVYTINCDKIKSIGLRPEGNLSTVVSQIIKNLKKSCSCV